MTDTEIQDIALANGFKLKEQPNGTMALNPYVFDFARKLLAKSQEEIDALIHDNTRLYESLNGEVNENRQLYERALETANENDSLKFDITLLNAEISGCSAVNDVANAEIEELRKENDVLRASLANSGGPCVYCSLPKEDWAKCEHGFPGCGRADDAMLCPNVGASLEAEEEVKRLREAVNAIMPLIQKAVFARSTAEFDQQKLMDAAIALRAELEVK